MRNSDITIHKAIVHNVSSAGVYVRIPSLLGSSEIIALHEPSVSDYKWPPTVGDQVLVAVEGDNFNRVYTLLNINNQPDNIFEIADGSITTSKIADGAVTSAKIAADTQQTTYPRGVVALTKSTTSSATITTETVTLTGSSFTAVANRYYKITYFESGVSGTNTDANARIRITNISGTVLALQSVAVPSAGGGFVNLVYVGTFTAGVMNLVATIQGTGGVVANRHATRPSFLLVEDIGPA